MCDILGQDRKRIYANKRVTLLCSHESERQKNFKQRNGILT